MTEPGTEVPPPAAELSPGLGLALSGGGFRAALFHIGVLARLAEMGILRDVEVISTVSGGSIIGALYYLHLKRLLESKADGEIGLDDHSRLLGELESMFVPAVQRNLRVRTFANLFRNVRMSLSPGYSRSNRMGELYEEHFYRPALGLPAGSTVRMQDLRIAPKGAPPDFYPLRDNRSRINKVPVLLINATTLNTGRNWRFEAAGMGEPVRTGEMALDIDKAMRLRSVARYGDLPRPHRDIGLGAAVASSTGIPGLFPPLPLSDLYAEGVRVQLADGGIHDNQGIQGLLDLSCTRFVVSDAGGQLDDRADPGTSALAVLLRTNQIQFGRIREEQLFRLSDLTDKALFVHIRKGLPVKIVAPLGREDRPVDRPGLDSVVMRGYSPDSAKESLARALDEARASVAGFTGYEVLETGSRVEETGSQEYWVRVRIYFRPQAVISRAFGIHPDVQRLLSKLRTDLDSFSDTEAMSLMTSGYRIAGWEAERRGWKAAEPAAADSWSFQQIARWMERPNPSYIRRLTVGQRRFMKPLSQSWPVGSAVALLTLGMFLLLVGRLWDVSAGIRFRWGPAVLVAAIAAAGALLARAVLGGWWRVLPLRTALGVAAGILQALLLVPVWLAARFHLLVLDPLFLRLGKISRLKWP